MTTLSDELVERLRRALVAEVMRQTGGNWPIAEYDERIVIGLVDAHLNFADLALATIEASGIERIQGALAYAYDNGFRWPERFGVKRTTLSADMGEDQ